MPRQSPAPAIRYRALTAPAEVLIRHRFAPGSHRASSTSQPKRTWGITPSSTATRRMYSRISGCGENVELQSGLGANENE